MSGFSTVSAVDTILDKGNFTLEDLLNEDEIIQECRATNDRLINFLKERSQLEQLVRYIVEEAPDDAVKGRTLKFPFIASEIFTCEVDIMRKALVEDEELMNLLFSFLEPEHPHSTVLAGYFSKVVVCLLQKSASLMSYIQAHPDIIQKLVDLIGITSIMEVLIRLVGADEYFCTTYTDSLQWLEDIDVLEMIVSKFSSSDSLEVHANAAETLCAIARYAPSELATKISNSSFISRLLHHALEDSRPRSVLVYSLSVCIYLLDPKRQTSGTYYMYNQQLPNKTAVTSPETVEGMLDILGDLLKLLDVSVDENVLPTTYGKLQPPLGTHRLKIVEFISVITTVGSEAAEKELIRLGVLRRILELFFEYPYNNFLHHRVEEIIVCCLESKNASLVKHILEDCNLVRSIIDAERNSVLSTDENNAKPTVPTEGRMPPRIGNVGHMTRIANKLVQLMADNDYIYAYLQDNSEWVEWHTNVLLIRNTLGNVSDWECGWSVVPTIDVNGSSLIPDSLKRKLKLTWRPAVYHDQGRDSDDDDYQDRDYDVSALANNLSQAFRYGISENDDNIEASGSLERDDEDAYFDDESAEAFIFSLHLGDDDQESGSVFENLQWFPYEDENEGSDEEENEGGGDEIPDVAECVVPDSEPSSTDTTGNNSADDSKPNVTDNPFESAEQGDSTQPSDTITESAGPSQSVTDDLPDGQNEPNEASSPCCTTKGDSDVTSSSPDPQRESEVDTMTSQTQEESETHTDWTESGL
ncbi:serine/threonine-protein phosphatase 6 regulatory subunit 3-like protein [Tanacetum coccineum]